jgi:hypothetical protein
MPELQTIEESKSVHLDLPTINTDNEEVIVRQKFTKTPHLCVGLIYLASCIIVVGLEKQNDLWWMWGLITLISISIYACVILTSSNQDDNFYQLVHFLLYPPLVIFIYGGIALIYLYDDNKGKIPIQDVPLIANRTLSWCYTTCPLTNNITFTCEKFNQDMIVTDTKYFLALCTDRVTKMCADSTSLISKQCEDIWTYYIYALNFNDANTKPAFDIGYNLFIGSIISFCTSLLFMFIIMVINCILRT